MRRRAAFTGILVLASAVLPWTPPAACAAPPDDAAASADPVGEARRLRDEAKVLFRSAGDTTLEGPERGKFRKECFKKLKTARELLDAHIAKNPGDAERVDPDYVDIATMMFWIKKEMTLDEVKEVMGGGGGSKPSTPALPPAPGPAGDSGGIGGARRTDPPQTPPAPPPGPGAPPVNEKPPAPETPAGPSLADLLAVIDGYAKAHPGDIPGQVELYDEFLTAHPDPSTPEFARAAETRRALDLRLKEIYRTARDDDPESVRTEDPAEAAKRLAQLVADLSAPEAPARARAAKFLGYLGSDEGVQPLIDLLRSETDPAVRDAASQGLADLASRRAFARIVRTAERDDKFRKTAVGVLGLILAKGGPAGRLAGEELAGLADKLAEEPQYSAIATLKEHQPAGSVGLARAAATFVPENMRAELIEVAGKAKDPRAVPYLARFLFVNPGGVRRDQAFAAREAIEGIGKPAVRYLIPVLDDPALALWSAELLKKITGVKHKDDKRKTWETWYRKNRKSLE